MYRRDRPVCPGGGAQWKSLNYSAGITITTYTMVAHSGRRSYEAQQMMDFLTGTEWGLVLLDEVHVVPANGTDPWSQVGHRCCWLVVTRGRGRAGTVSATVFRKVVTTVPAHCKMGLTGMKPRALSPAPSEAR